MIRCDYSHDAAFAGEIVRVISEDLAHRTDWLCHRNGGLFHPDAELAHACYLVQDGGKPAPSRVAHEAQSWQVPEG